MIRNWQGNFDEERSWVRDQPYTNSKAEREAIQRIDKEIFDQVRPHERQLVGQGQREVADLTATIQTIERLTDKLQGDITGPLTNATWTEAPVDIHEAVAQYNVLFQQAQEALARIAKKESHLSWEAEKLQDPYNDLAHLLNKFFTGNKRFETRPITWVASDNQGSGVEPSSFAASSQPRFE